MVHIIRTPEKEKRLRRAKRKETERKISVRKDKEWKYENKNEDALRAQAESREGKVAACWYDQSYDMSS